MAPWTMASVRDCRTELGGTAVASIATMFQSMTGFARAGPMDGATKAINVAVKSARSRNGPGMAASSANGLVQLRLGEAPRCVQCIYCWRIDAAMA